MKTTFKKSLKIYVLLSLTFLAAFAVEVVLFKVSAPIVSVLVMYPLMAITGVVAIGYIFGMPGVWLFNATVGRMIERIEHE